MTTKKPNPKPPPDDPEESARFIEAAKSLDVDKDRAAFGRAFKRVIPRKSTNAKGPKQLR